MRIMPLLMALAAASPAAAAERAYSVTDFDRVQIDGAYEVTLATGGSSHARAIGDGMALNRVSIDVQGRTLRVRPSASGWGGYPGDASAPVRIVLSTRDVRAATLIGSGSLAIDRVRGLRVELAVSGSGSMSIGAADADTMIVGLLGSGSIAAGGRAKQLRVTVQGTGDFDGRGLTGDDAQVVANTSGTIAVGAARTAKINAIGRGAVEILGPATCTLSGPAAAFVKCGRYAAGQTR
jgi:hypothetical protein